MLIKYILVLVVLKDAELQVTSLKEFTNVSECIVQMQTFASELENIEDEASRLVACMPTRQYSI